MALSIQTILIGKYQYRLDKAGIPGDPKEKIVDRHQKVDTRGWV